MPFSVQQIDQQLRDAREKRGDHVRRARLLKTQIETLEIARREARREERLNNPNPPAAAAQPVAAGGQPPAAAQVNAPAPVVPQPAPAAQNGDEDSDDI